MKLQGEDVARSLLVNESFDLVAKIPFLKNKWITTQAWFNLIKKEVPNCAINDITLRWFTAYLLNSGKFIQDSNYPSPDGFYSRKRKMKLDGMIAQKTITCFLVTDAGERRDRMIGSYKLIDSKGVTKFIISIIVSRIL